jgi:hypothetical protein
MGNTHAYWLISLVCACFFSFLANVAMFAELVQVCFLDLDHLPSPREAALRGEELLLFKEELCFELGAFLFELQELLLENGDFGEEFSLVSLHVPVLDVESDAAATNGKEDDVYPLPHGHAGD